MEDNKKYNEDKKYDIYLKYLKNSDKVNKEEKNIIMDNLRNIIVHNNKFFVADEFDVFIHHYIQSYKEKEILSNNLKRFMSMRGLNVTDLANKLDYKYSTVNDWVNGVNYPRIDKLNRLAEALGVTKRELTEPHKNNLKSNRIPVLGKIPAGIPIEAIEDVLDYEEIPQSWLTGDKEYFALKIDGRSMYPMYCTRRYCYI